MPAVSPLARRVLLITVYLLGVFFFFEGVSRAVLSVRSFRHRVENDNDSSWRLRWVRRQNRMRRLYYTFDEHSPTRGWAVKANARDLPAFSNGATVNTNSEGVRGQREYANPKPPGITRILVFGDSFTFGDEVSDDETYAAQLERMLPGTEVVNLGVHGYGHDQMLLYLEEVGARYQPDVVLLGFVFIDMTRNLLGFRDFAKPRFDVQGDHLVLRNTPVSSPTAVRAWEPFRLKFADLLTLLYFDWRWPSGPPLAARARVTAAILDEFRRTATALGATPVLAYLPIEAEIATPEIPMFAEEQFFLQYSRERATRSVDLRPSFLAEGGKGVQLETVGHWGPREHQIAAEAIATYLLDGGLAPRTGPLSTRSRERAPAGARPEDGLSAMPPTGPRVAGG